MQLSERERTRRLIQGARPALEVQNLNHSYGRKAALSDVSFTIEPGRFTALLGPNGAGKTTLFGLLTRLLALQTGRIRIEGVEITAGAAALAPLGLVFQQPTLDLDLSVRQNLTYFAALRGLSRAEAKARIADELTRLDMAERAREPVRALNGGHRRRVELARALLHQPSILLLDEPTVGLDVEARGRICRHVHALARERGIAVLWSTHLIDEVWPDDDLVVLGAGAVLAKGRAGDIVAETGADDLAGAFTRLTGVETAGAPTLNAREGMA
ncbi:ABC transporter ATP-binding protein [Acuticoccus yangtzensis]|uniref:ABC transporter ATP-binding protein n=1 Tax=Acuticoccus yangtzensis TaxID=1443441 RepID=UPI000AA6177A|nr:ABC transporter ATP-binding protein [Acuticoccus yangtzensis]